MRSVIALVFGILLMTAAASVQAKTGYCNILVKDINTGRPHLLLLTHAFTVDNSSTLLAEWRAHVKPAVDVTVKTHGRAASIDYNCPTAEKSIAETERWTRHTYNTATSQGLMAQWVDWRPGNADDGSSSGGGSSTDTQGDTEDSSEAGADEIRGVNVDNPPPPSGYSQWRYHGSYGPHDFVKVYWAAKVSKDEIRVLWRCVNGSSVDVACSVGNGKKKTYQCDGADVLVDGEPFTYASPERATVRSGRHYTFPSDWACRGKNATLITPSADIGIDIE